MKKLLIYPEARNVIMKHVDVISGLTLDEYTKKFDLLGGGTIGGHTRHVIELFQQLDQGYENGCVSYDERKRNKRLEEDVDLAMECLADIISRMEKPDKPLFLRSLYLSREMAIESSYFRELLYNIEHCIHHHALIRVALLCLGNSVDENFGVAKSTWLYRQESAASQA